MPISAHSPLLLLTGPYQLGLGSGKFLTELLQLRVAGLLHLLSNAFDQFIGALILGCLLDVRDHVGEVITSHFGTPIFTRGTFSPLESNRVPFCFVPDNSADRAPDRKIPTAWTL
jgi:hypothetical protein